MDAMTKAVYRQAIKLYELYLEGKPINVIDPDGSTLSRVTLEGRVQQLKAVLEEEESQH